MATTTQRSYFGAPSPRNRLANPEVLKAFLETTLAFQTEAKKGRVRREAQKGVTKFLGEAASRRAYDDEKTLSERLWDDNELETTLVFQTEAKKGRVRREAQKGVTKFLGEDTSRRAYDDEKILSERLWDKNLDVAIKAEDTKFIKGIEGGNLDPRAFGGYTVQDAAYCNAATENLKSLAGKGSDLQEFFMDRYKSYKEYTEFVYKTWFLKADGADLGPAAKWYVELEREVAHENGDLYYLVSMLPCLRLWAYLANKMKKQGKDKDDNIYKFWMDENADPNYGHAQKVEEVVNEHSGSIDEEKANQIYRKCMYAEVNFFRSACGEKLLPPSL